MATPFFKARWNQHVKVVRPRALLTVDQHQAILARKDVTTYSKWINLNGHIVLGQVVQMMDEGEYTIRLLVHGSNSMGNSYDFGLWYLPCYNDFDCIEMKSCAEQEMGNYPDMLPCPPEYITAMESQLDMEAAPEGW